MAAAAAAPPACFHFLFPLASLHRLASLFYKVAAYGVLFSWLVVRSTAMRVNAHGQLILTDVILVQTPPAIPFLILIKYFILPLVGIYNAIMYYCFIIPASFMNPAALHDVVEQCSLVKKLLRKEEAGDGRGAGRRLSVFMPAVAVDWHNYGYTIMRDNKQPRVLVALYKFLEIYGNAGHLNITVSEAMRRSLYAIGAVTPPPRASEADDIVVLYDKAPAFFQPHSRAEMLTAVLQPLQQEQQQQQQQQQQQTNTSATSVWGIAQPPRWVCEEQLDGPTEALPGDGAGESPNNRSHHAPSSQVRAERHASNRKGIILVGSTSWTDEDDYTMLVDALEHIYERAVHARRYHTEDSSPSRPSSTDGTTAQGSATSDPSLLKLWVVITGKGASRPRFEQQVLNSHFYQKQQQQREQAPSSFFVDFITVSTVYLQSYQQYSVLLGAADAGLCFHFSTSLLDLPMKAVDMIGCGLPVAAWHYPVLTELMSPTAAAAASVAASNSTAHFRMECERGYFFRHARDLEFLFAQWIRLTTAERVAAQRQEHHRSAHAPQQMISILTDLFTMQARTRAARKTAVSWKENWNATLRPRLAQYS
ncbi:beta-1,4-mannosyltransferase [Strigomonas culicis]|uniref:Beta-1,4-mannosyltransferase n=1 Tax=Strigomonas culicis TaxID=28005 RepID=S9TRJ5_9TRYP|nr:beta-1,4-mannosyltransferase [Strigomonas culicis]|eukprot:EPY19224.1 beta-1,4-mannosyltransferase [Strigomonas culicis]